MLELWWLNFKGFVLGAMGSLIALRFFDNLTTPQRWLTVIGGSMLAGLGHDLVLELLGVSDRHDGLISFVIGLFGMALVSQILYTVKQIDWAEVRSWLPGRKG